MQFGISETAKAYERRTIEGTCGYNRLFLPLTRCGKTEQMTSYLDEKAKP